ATAAFDRPRDAGEYVLHNHGYRTAFPRDPVTLEIRVSGDAEVHRAERGAGGFDLALPFRLQAAVRRPWVSVTHPLWSPHDATGSSDTRRLSSLFEYAWIEAAETKRPRRAARRRDAMADLRVGRQGLGAFSRHLP
ncbi:MAG TPA: hypothetical protein VGE98_11375, partial [Thermoanaerobaculia bacterium]